MIPAWLSGYTAKGGPYRAPWPWAIFASHLRGYMHRWIVATPWAWLRVHHILRRDADRDPHDHPFDFASLILHGGYVEERYDSAGRLVETVRARPGDVLHRVAEDLHILVHVEPGTWTLVLTGPKRRSWGFLTVDGWVDWRVYDRSKE